MSNEMAMQAGMEDVVDSQIETNPQIEITPSVSRDEALHGGGEDTNETPALSESNITQVERPTPPTPIKTFFSTIVSALGRHEVEVTDPKGNKKVLKSRDVFELEQEQFARLRATESKEKWDGSSETSKWKKFGQGAVRFFDRMWRSTVTEKVHLAKEKKHGMELSATVGIEGAISEEFNALIDKKARERIENERDTGWKRIKGKTKDFFQELIGHERDLHKYKVKAAEDLITEYRSNPGNAEHPLYQLINRDTATREELAARIGESPLELIKQANAKDKKVSNIKLKGEAGAKVDHFLKQEIIGKAMDDILDQATKDGGRPTKISAGLRHELDQKIRDFFFSADFQAWRATLKPEEQAAFENSFTVASDILLQFEEGGMAENIHQCREHYQGANRLDFDIELALGTAQLSAHTESMGEAGFLERRRERASLNEKLLGQFKNHDPYSPENMGPGLRRERMLSAAHAIFNNEFTVAWLTAVGGRSLIKSASTAAHAIPIIGSAGFAAGIAGLKEWARHGQMRATYGVARAEGLQFPEAMNAIRAKEMESADYHRVEFGTRTQQFLELSDKLKSGARDENTLLLALATAADSTARLQLGSERDINLLVASVDGPEGRGIRNRELRIHDQARSALTAQLTEIINGNQALADQLANTIGILPGNANVPQNQHTAENMLDILRLHRYDNLLNGTQVSGSLHDAIGSLSIADSEAIKTRDQAYRKLRRESTVKRALTTAVIAGGVGALGAGLSHYSELHEQVVQSGTEHQLVPLLNHNTPTHVDPLETAHITHPVTGEELGAMHAHVPAGTHIEAMQVRVGGPDDLETHYNLVTNVLKTDGQPTVLVRDMQFDHEGKLEITPGIRDFLNHNHIKVDYTSHEQTVDVVGNNTEITPTSTEIDYTHWTNTLAYKDMPNGPDGYWADNLNHSFSANPDTSVDVDRVTDINGIRYFLRGMENWIYKQENFKVDDSDGYHHVLHGGESIWSKLTGKPEYLVKYQGQTTEITHLPALFTTEEGNRRIAELIHESIKENPTGDINHIFSDDAHRIAWEMSYWGDEPHVPDANEVRTLLEYFGELPTNGSNPIEAVSEQISVPANDIWFTFDKDLSAVAEVPTTQIFTQTVPGWTQFIAGSIGYSRPLEAVEIRSETVPGRSNTYGYGMYTYGYENTNPELRAYYKGKLSETLVNNPDTNLDASVEIPNYIANMDENYKSELNTYMEQADMAEPMDKNCSAVVCIPVYTLGEGKVVGTSLEQYAVQFDKDKNKNAIDPSKVEFILFLNHPTPSREKIEKELGHSYLDGAESRVKNGKPEMYDTEEVVKQFMQKHPEMKIRIMKKEFAQRPVWGSIIKPFYDVALMRSTQRTGAINNDPLIITNDIDSVEMSPTYLRDLIAVSEKNLADAKTGNAKKIDGWVGKIDMPNHGYEKYPGFLAAERLYQYLDAQSRKLPDRMVITQGRNTAIRASSLAAIGGINPNTDAGADTEIGRMVAQARHNPKTIEFLNRAWIHSDPRRELDMWKKGIPLAYAWNEWAAMNVYGKGWKDRFNHAPEDPSTIDVEALKREIENESQRHGFAIDSPEMRFALISLGLRSKEQLQEVLDQSQKIRNMDQAKIAEETAKIGLKAGDYHIDNGKVIVDKPDFDVVDGNIVINRVDGIVENVKKFITEKRWEVTDRKKSTAMN